MSMNKPDACFEEFMFLGRVHEKHIIIMMFININSSEQDQKRSC